MSNATGPTVSAVIPLYNKGRYIERALSSALTQTRPASEIIVVDDGSTDDGPEKVLHFGGSGISLIRQKNRGPGAARNAGLAAAKSKYTAFLDADDEWLPSFLEQGLSVLEDKSADAAAVWTGYYRAPGMKRNSEIFGELSGGMYEITPATDIRLAEKLINFMWTSATVIKTDIARKWGGFYDEGRCLRGEDRHLWLKLLFNERIGIIPEPHAIYHLDASELCGGGDETGSSRPIEINPFLRCPEGVLSTCPESKLHLLRELLEILFLEEIKKVAKSGRPGQSYGLLSSFTGSCRLSGRDRLIAYSLIILAPLLPALRRLREMATG